MDQAQAIGLTSRVVASGSRGLARYLPTRLPLRMKNRSPLVSFTFDDVPESAFTEGAPLLDRAGVRGTFYIAPGTCGAPDTHWTVISRSQVQELARAGHEIGCHTSSHVKVQSLDRDQLVREDEACREALQDLCGQIPLKNFAYPFGSVSFPHKVELDRTYASCRSIYPGFNTGHVDLGMLRVQELYDRTCTIGRVNTLLDEAERTNAWLIFYTHDVSDNPSWIGCSPELLAATVQAVKARGFACVAIDDALDLIGAAEARPRRSQRLVRSFGMR